MDYDDAVHEVLERAARIKPPGSRVNSVVAARREFARNGSCEHGIFGPIEDTLKRCLSEWTPEQKREIWLSTESGMQDDPNDEPMEYFLECELLQRLMEELSEPRRQRRARQSD